MKETSEEPEGKVKVGPLKNYQLSIIIAQSYFYGIYDQLKIYFFKVFFTHTNVTGEEGAADEGAEAKCLEERWFE